MPFQAQPALLPSPRFIQLLAKQKTTPSSFPGSCETSPIPVSPSLPARSQRRFPREKDWAFGPARCCCRRSGLRDTLLGKGPAGLLPDAKPAAPMPNQPHRFQTSLTGALPARGEPLQELPGQHRAQPGKASGAERQNTS